MQFTLEIAVNLWEMADYRGELNRQKSAIRFHENALQHVQTESRRASLLNNLGIQFVNNNQYDRAGAVYSEAPFSATVLEYFDQLFQEVNQPFEQAKKQAGPFEEQIASLTDEADKVKPQEQIVQLLTNALQNHPDNRAIRTHLAGAYGNLARYQLFTRDFPAAEEAARRGLNTDSSQIWINANLALSLLFQGKYDEAEPLFRKCENEPVNNSTVWISKQPF